MVVGDRRISPRERVGKTSGSPPASKVSNIVSRSETPKEELVDKLNVFNDSLNWKLGTENRLTWALMNLIRMSPIIRTAFLDIVRDKQERPVPALTTLSTRECVVQTQTGALVAKEGRLVAIGITAEGGDVDAEIQPKDRDAIYDGVVTFIAPESSQHQQESLTLTVESKLGPEKTSLGEERKIAVDPQAVILAWRDIFATLNDLELRGLVGPAEGTLIRDFIDYVAAKHPKLNPFDRFAVCRDDLYLLNRRCEVIMRKIDRTEAWHRSSPIIAVGFPSFKQIWLQAEKDEGSWKIKLGFAPGDTMAQARKFWPKVNTKRLLALQDKDEGWLLEPNLHFSYMRSHVYGAKKLLAVNKYVELWKSGEMEIASLYRDDAGSYRHNWDRLVAKRLISPDDVEPLEKETTQTKRDRISMVPGLGISYTWSAERAAQLDRDGTFVREVIERICEVTETWGEVPDFCR